MLSLVYWLDLLVLLKNSRQTLSMCCSLALIEDSLGAEDFEERQIG